MTMENEMTEKTRVLFVCTGNTCRSQMAEGFVNKWGGEKIEAKSAGSHPGEAVSELAVFVMDEVGIDISHHVTNSFEDFKGQNFDWVITLCDYARDFCPIFTSSKGEAKKLHWSIPDPYKAFNDLQKSLEAYRDARDMIAGYVSDWIEDEFGIKVVYDPGR
jgi:arsenate reductase